MGARSSTRTEYFHDHFQEATCAVEGNVLRTESELKEAVESRSKPTSILQIAGRIFSLPIDVVSWLITGVWNPELERRTDALLEARRAPEARVPVDPITGEPTPFVTVFDEEGNPHEIPGPWLQESQRIQAEFDRHFDSLRSPVVVAWEWLRGRLKRQP